MHTSEKEKGIKRLFISVPQEIKERKHWGEEQNATSHESCE